MRRHVGRIFHTLTDASGPVDIEDLALEDCDLFNCRLWSAPAVDRRSRARRVEITRCRMQACGLGPAILDEVEIRHLAAPDLVIMWGTLFRHVTLAGRICSLKLNTWVDIDLNRARQAEFDAWRHRFYADVDWALDISGARLRTLDLQGIPAGLVRRDPATQAVLTTARLAAVDWRRLLPHDNYWFAYAESLAASEEREMVIAAALGANTKYRHKSVADLAVVRELGLTEPD